MTRVKETIWCDGCGVEILWAPVLEAARGYCCAACQRGWTCLCGDRQEMEEGRRADLPESSLAAETLAHGPAA